VLSCCVSPPSRTHAAGGASVSGTDQGLRPAAATFNPDGRRPLARQDLFDLIDEAHALGIGVSITPAATPKLTRDVLVRLKRQGIDGLGLSLDGSTAARHDSIRSVPGTLNWISPFPVSPGESRGGRVPWRVPPTPLARCATAKSAGTHRCRGCHRKGVQSTPLTPLAHPDEHLPGAASGSSASIRGFEAGEKN
jgi:hypothetical protein